MPVARLITYDWANARARDVVVSDPAWSEIEAAIRALNNQNLNGIYNLTARTLRPTYALVGSPVATSLPVPLTTSAFRL